LITATRRTPPKGGRPGTRPSRRVPPPQRSFLDRNRVRLLWAGLIVVALIAGGLDFASFTQKGYVCLSEWTPGPTPSTAPGATPRIGFIQDDMGRSHVAVGTRVKYTFCPPASGFHYNAVGAGPIQTRLYGPNEATVPQNWIHNMEHGGLVIVYRCNSGDSGCSDAQQAAFRDFFSSFPDSPICHVPKGTISPVIARFDDMQFPFAALVWDEILPLDQWDPAQVLAFFNQNAERTNPEKTYCSGPTASPSPSDTTAPSTAPTTAPTTEPTSGATPAPTGT